MLAIRYRIQKVDCTIVIHGRRSLPGTCSLSEFVKALGGRSDVLPESFGP